MSQDEPVRTGWTPRSVTLGADFLAPYRGAFDKKVDRGADAGGCWKWTGCTDGRGYGKFTAAGIQMRAHRAALAFAGTHVPDDLVVRHDCDNTLCVNPDHLRLGTQADNVADTIRRGRHARAKGGFQAALELIASGEVELEFVQAFASAVLEELRDKRGRR